MWITGASSGIGAALALRLAQAGVKLALSARSVEKLNSVKQQCVGESWKTAKVAEEVTQRSLMWQSVALLVGGGDGVGMGWCGEGLLGEGGGA